MFSTNDIKVIIVGKFDCSNDKFTHFNKTPNLKTIFKLLNSDFNNNLTSWYNQGVLLLDIKYIDNVKSFYKSNIVWISCNIKYKIPVNNVNILNDKTFLELGILSNKLHGIKTMGKLRSPIRSKIYWNPSYIKPSYMCVGFTDGSWRKSVDKAAWAVYFPKTFCGETNLISGYKRNICGGNNIDAEGTAILKCFEVFNHITKYFYVDVTFIIISDCELWIDILSGKKQARKATQDIYCKMCNIIADEGFEFEFELHHKSSHDKPQVSVSYINLAKKIELNHICVLEEMRLGNIEADELVKALTE
jgi:hypothetical protein